MKKILIATLFTVLSMSAIANDEAALTEATADYIQTVLSTCKEYALEDEVAPKDLNTYLLDCINDDLEANDFKKVMALPMK